MAAKDTKKSSAVRATRKAVPPSKPARKAGSAVAFEAVLERGDKALGWTIARVPVDVHKAFPSMLRLRVKGTVAALPYASVCVPFRTSLFPVRGLPGEGDTPSGAGAFFLLVNKAAQREAGLHPGDRARFTLAADLEDRPAELPDVLAVLLDEEPGLRAFYDGLSESWRREIGKWIGGVKSDAARMTRCEQMAERLLSAMEAEVSLPPLIDRTFRARPKARAGWAKMTPVQRRQSLLAVFYYQTPEARQRRLDKVCDEAEKRA
jgi:hypothetical protein